MLVGSVVACERCVTVTWTRRTSCVHPYLQDRYNELHSESHSSGDAKWAIVGVKGVCAAVSWACVRAYTHSFTRTFSSVVQLFFCLLACRINGSVDEAVSTQKRLSTHYYTLDVLKNATCQYAADNTSSEFVHMQALLSWTVSLVCCDVSSVWIPLCCRRRIFTYQPSVSLRCHDNHTHV